MSDEIFPLEVWQSGTNENSIPANDNALRVEAFGRNVLSMTTTAQPGSPSDGDVYIIASTHTGSQWATFSPNDVAIYRDGTWYAFAPVAGLTVNLGGVLKYFDGSTWGDVITSATVARTVTALSIASGTVNIDLALGDYFTLSLTSNVTSITFSNLPASGKAQSIAIRIRQDATGGRSVTFPSSFKAITGSDVGVQALANAYTVLHLETFDQGTRWEYAMKGGAA